MDNLEGCRIDEEFRNQLETSTSQTPITIIATIRETFEVTGLLRNLQGYRRRSPEELQTRLAISEAETKMMEPVCKYLDELGVQYSPFRAMHSVSAQMTPQQILDFIKQPYVQIICPDAKLHLID